MVSAIAEVLNDLGWNDGFRIPIANAENKRLEEEVGDCCILFTTKVKIFKILNYLIEHSL